MTAEAVKQSEPEITPTRLQSWLRCGQAYYYQYVEGLTEVPKRANAQGTIAHRLLEYDGDLWGPPTKPGRSLNQFDAIFWDSLEELKQNGLDTTSDEELEIHSFLSEALYSFKKQADLRRMEILEREIKLEYPFKGKIITGTLDAFVRFPDTPKGFVEVIDYKTGKRKPTSAKLDRDIQLGLYYLAARHNGYKVHRMWWIFIRDFLPYKKAYKGKKAGELRGPGFIPIQVTDSDITAIYDLAGPIVDAINARIFPANAYGDACITCQFTEKCPSFSIGTSVQEEWSV